MNRSCAVRLTLLVVVLALSGCSYTRQLMRPEKLVSHSQYTVDCMAPGGPGGAVCRPAPDPVKGPLDLDTFRFTPSDSLPAYTQVITAGSGSDRNRLQDVLFERADAACGCYLDDLYARTAARKTALKTVSLFASSASAMVSGEQAQRVLAGVAAAALGFDTIIDAEVLQNVTVTLIVSQIQTSREQIRTEINGKRTKTLAEYSVDEAIRDVGRYHAACSFVSAISELTKSANRPVTTRSQLLGELDKLKGEREAVRKNLAAKDIDKAVKSSYERELKEIDDRMLGLQIRLSATTE